jgi:HEAT repeat protein
LPDDAWFASILGAERIAMEDGELARYLQMLASGDEKSREAAALALGRSGPESIEPLADMLAVDDPDIRWWAARGLAEVGGDEVIQPLTGVLCDPDPDVRACAALGLGRIGAARAAPALAEKLADESAFVASIAADALTMIGEPAVGSLVPMLVADSAHTRLLAVRALGRIRSQSAIGPLFGALEDDSYLVRYYAQETLDSMGVGMVYFSP